MLEPTKKHPTNTTHKQVFYIVEDNITYAIPKKIAEKYRVKPKTNRNKNKDKTPWELFAELDKKYTKAGALLRGVRARESLTQVEFAKKLGVSQNNLSKMENGKRPIGKIIAKRIQKVFGTNYRYFLE